MNCPDCGSYLPDRAVDCWFCEREFQEQLDAENAEAYDEAMAQAMAPKPGPAQ